MLKGFLSSLIVGALFFAAGGISVAVFGTRAPQNNVAYVDQVEWRGQQLLIDEEVTGEKTWYFNELEEINAVKIETSNAKTYIAPSPDNTLMISAKSDDWEEIGLYAEYNDGTLRISVDDQRFNGFVFNIWNSGTVMISVPDKIYNSLTLDVGSGSLSARGIAAWYNTFDIGSGSFEYEQAEGVTADVFKLDIGSGSVKIANAAASEYDIFMGSGSFDISGLTGTGTIEIGSGSGTAEFAEVGSPHTLFDLGSGKLTVYIPDDTSAYLNTHIGSGVVAVDCCGISERITDDRNITLNGGAYSVVLTADLGSGKVEFLDSSKFSRPVMFSDFPHFPSETAERDEVGTVESSVTAAAAPFENAEYIGGVTWIGADEPELYWYSTAETTLYHDTSGWERAN